jgi:hypothetical protein
MTTPKETSLPLAKEQWLLPLAQTFTLLSRLTSLKPLLVEISLPMNSRMFINNTAPTDHRRVTSHDLGMSSSKKRIVLHKQA